MPKHKLPLSKQVYISFACLFLILVIVMPRIGKFNYSYKKGSAWGYETLFAKFDFPILKTPQQLQADKKQAGDNTIPYYKYYPSVLQNISSSLEDVKLGQYYSIKPDIISSLLKIYSTGVMADADMPNIDKKHNNTDQIIYIQKDKRAYKIAASNVYNLTTAKQKLCALLSSATSCNNLDSLLSNSGVYATVVPNLVYDKETTDIVHSENVNYISPTLGYVSSGQIIVSKGELVTAEIKQMLDSYKVEFENTLGYGAPRVLLWVGNALLAVAICFILFFCLLYTNPTIFKESNKYIYVMFIVTLMAILSLIVEHINAKALYVVPFSLFALYLVAFFKKRMVVPVYIIALFPLLVFAHFGIELFVMNVVAGILALYVFQFFNRGWRQFVFSMIIFGAMILTYAGFKLIYDVYSMGDWKNIISIFIGCVLLVAGYPLIYLFEKLFGLLSNYRLMELCDTNSNTLLQDLAQKAPGTFQHSLQVMNMCDAATKSIGGDVLMARAGALYHDIGKMLNPQCFVENETMGVNFHKDLTAIESANEIIKHVTEGMKLANKYSLPKEIQDFIITHHGTTCVQYFYTKYVNEGGNPNDKYKFCYPGIKPQTKEQVILMLCDTLEAASRTLKDHNPKTYNDFVEKIFLSKASEGQFDNADISLKEITIIKKVLKTYLAQLYHERIVYPTRIK